MNASACPAVERAAVRSGFMAPWLRDADWAPGGPRRRAGSPPGGASDATPGRAGATHDLALRHPLRILVAEDNPVNQALALAMLGHMGYAADVAHDGLEALDCLERQTYDLVLMDVRMPRLDGLETTRRLRARDPEGQRVRVVALTANALAGDRDICLAAGMDGYLAKPLEVDQLAAVLLATPRLGGA